MRKLVLRVGLTLFAFAFFSRPAHAFDPDTTVFIGSSTIEFWETLSGDFKPAKTLNLGVGGTTYTYLLQHAPDYAAKYPARRFVIYSGDNDLELGARPRAIADQFRQLAALLHERLPSCTITLIDVKPSPKRRKNIALIRETNALLREAAKPLAYVSFVDVFPLMTNAKGEPRAELFREDGLHLNDKGYALWTKALKKSGKIGK